MFIVSGGWCYGVRLSAFLRRLHSNMGIPNEPIGSGDLWTGYKSCEPEAMALPPRSLVWELLLLIDILQQSAEIQVFKQWHSNFRWNLVSQPSQFLVKSQVVKVKQCNPQVSHWNAGQRFPGLQWQVLRFGVARCRARFVGKTFHGSVADRGLWWLINQLTGEHHPSNWFCFLFPAKSSVFGCFFLHFFLMLHRDLDEIVGA